MWILLFSFLCILYINLSVHIMLYNFIILLLFCKEVCGSAILSYVVSSRLIFIA